ncbi:MAG TPA: hypothetical protein VGB53_16935 [Rubricoccaceae bacterium]
MPRPLRIALVIEARLDRAGYHPRLVAIIAALCWALDAAGIHP